MIAPIHFQIAGVLLISLAISHAWFPRVLGWKQEAAALSLLNRQIFFAHSFFIALGVLLNGLLFLGWAELLLTQEPLSIVLLTGIGLFWFARLIFQLFVYDARHWQGRRLETLVHCVLSALWTYLVLIVVLSITGPPVRQSPHNDSERLLASACECGKAPSPGSESPEPTTASSQTTNSDRFGVTAEEATTGQDRAKAVP